MSHECLEFTNWCFELRAERTVGSLDAVGFLGIGAFFLHAPESIQQGLDLMHPKYKVHFDSNALGNQSGRGGT
jgi:hypothetical protein